YRDWKRLEAVAMEAQKNYAAREAERSEVQDELLFFKKLAPREGEWEQVCAEQSRLQHGSSLLAAAQSALEALTESEGASLAQLSAVASRLRALSAHDTRLAPIVELVESAAARSRYEAAAKKLTAKRQHGAQAFSKAVTSGLQKLAMAGGRFEVSLNKLDEPGTAGAEEIEFQVASHPSLPLRPLARVASGGELSRISLAIHM